MFEDGSANPRGTTAVPARPKRVKGLHFLRSWGFPDGHCQRSLAVVLVRGFFSWPGVSPPKAEIQRGEQVSGNCSYISEPETGPALRVHPLFQCSG